MNNCIIVFHQGWTDIIVCIGIIFYNMNKYDNVSVLIREDSRKMIDFIFRNNKNINIIYIEKQKFDDYRIIDNILNKYNNVDILKYGACYNKMIKNNYEGASRHYFYEAYNIRYTESWNSFNIERDYELENKKYNEIISKTGEKYIVINEDRKRNLIIDRKYIDNDLKIININGSSDIVFDMLKIIENAKEIHLISTFWSVIIYQLQKKYNMFENIPIYFHNYVRNGNLISLYSDINWTFY